MSFDLNTLVSLLFIAGGGGAVAGVLNVVKTLRGGKIESEETLIKRLDNDNKNQQRRAEEAEAGRDQAEKEAEGYRKERNAAQEALAKLRWVYIEKTGQEPPDSGGTND